MQVEVGSEQIEDHLGAAARRARGHESAVPVHDRGQIARPLAGHLADHMLGDRCERDGLMDGEERQPVLGAGGHQIAGDVAELRLAYREPGHPGPARMRTNGSESAASRRQARPVRTSSPPDR